MTTATQATIRQITKAGVENAKSLVDGTSKTTHDGSPNPNYEAAVANLAEVTRHYEAKEAVISLAAKQGFRRNNYAGKCVRTGEQVKEACGFALKNDDGKWQVFSFAAVVEIVGYHFA